MFDSFPLNSSSTTDARKRWTIAPFSLAVELCLIFLFKCRKCFFAMIFLNSKWDFCLNRIKNSFVMLLLQVKNDFVRCIQQLFSLFNFDRYLLQRLEHIETDKSEANVRLDYLQVGKMEITISICRPVNL